MNKTKTKGKRKWQLLTITYEYPEGLVNTTAPVQYAYFLTEDNEVIKKLVRERFF